MRAPPRAAAACAAALVVWVVAGPARGEDAWFGRDKAAHFGVSTVLGAGGYGLGAALWDERWPAALLGVGLSVGAGGAKELADLAGLGQPSWKDFTWDVVGALVGVGVAFGFDLALRGWGPGGVAVSGRF